MGRIAIGLLLVFGLGLLANLVEGQVTPPDENPDAPLTSRQRQAREQLERSHQQTFVNGSVNVLFPPLVAIVVLSLRLMKQYRFRIRLPTAAKALATARRERRPYAVLLRPFGADGFIHLQTLPDTPPEEPKPWWRRRSTRPQWRVWQDAWRSSVTAESLFAEAIQVVLGVSTTLALVEPWQLVLPPGPRFVRASSDWRRDVLDLLQGAVMVAILFPPGKDCTRSVRWEIEQCLRLGLVGRLVFLLPPEPMDTAHAARRGLRDLADLVPSIDRVPEGVIAACPQPSGPLRFWHVPPDPHTGLPKPVGAEAYSNCVYAAVEAAAKTRTARSSSETSRPENTPMRG